MASTEPVILPSDVQAALDAYLAARVDDATWEAYIARLGPGVALDLATDLCLWATADEDAREWIERLFMCDPDDEEMPDAIRGIAPCSRSVEEWLDLESGFGAFSLTLARTGAIADWRYTACYRGDDWESTATVTSAEWERWMQQARQVNDRAGISGYAVAACRAACLAWSPEWAREQVGQTVLS